MKMRSALLCLAVLLFAVRPLHGQDAEGCKDSTLISRFPGSVIVSCSDKPDDLVNLPMGSNKPDKRIEGEIHKITYKFPSTASKAQVVRNLNTALRRAGYTFDYDSGDYGDFTTHMGKTWICVQISGSGRIDQTVAIEKQLEQEVLANAAELSSNLTSAGHVVVHGILFDTGKAEVKAESAAALKEVAKLLQQDPKLKVYVVGHTDNVGALAANVELSRQRAAAVAQALTAQYGVPVSRLEPFGAGPYAPIATNDTDDGRAVNRRVELVKQ